MSTWTDKKLEELVREIRAHKGRGLGPEVNRLKVEIIGKLGPCEWERLFHKARVKAVMK
jgi:hypothetical protein